MDSVEIWKNIIREDQKHKKETGWSYFDTPTQKTDCRYCKYCFCDDSVGCLECQKDMSSDEIDRYFTNDEPCPYFEEQQTMEEVEQENAYYESLMG